MKFTVSRLLKLLAVSAVGIAFSIHVNSGSGTITLLEHSSPFIDKFLDVLREAIYYSIPFVFVVSLYVTMTSLIARFRSPESAYIVSFGRVASYVTSWLFLLFLASNTIVDLVQGGWNDYAASIFDPSRYAMILDEQTWSDLSITSPVLASCMILPMLGLKMKELLRHQLLDGLVAAHWILVAVVCLVIRCRTSLAGL